MSSCTKHVILIDTDIGLDDAGAVFMLLAAHKRGLVEVVAITTVHGNSTLANVNKNILRLLDAVDMLHIPVYSGAETPLVPPFLQQPAEPFHGQDGFGDTFLPHPKPEQHLKTERAALAIVNEAKARQGQLAIIAIGPLTNLAVARRLDPLLLSRLHSLHIMGGNTTGLGNFEPCCEFNFYCDPEAALIVLSCNVPVNKGTKPGKEESLSVGGETNRCPVYITPWETCLYGVAIPYKFRHSLGAVSTPEAELLNKGEAFLLKERRYDKWITCDQLSAAWMLDLLLGNKIFDLEERSQYSPLAIETNCCNVTVETQGRHTRGQMVLDKLGKIPYAVPVKILQRVNNSLYMRYLNTAFGQPF